MSDVIRQQHVVITAHEHQVAQAPPWAQQNSNLTGGGTEVKKASGRNYWYKTHHPLVTKVRWRTPKGARLSADLARPALILTAGCVSKVCALVGSKYEFPGEARR